MQHRLELSPRSLHGVFSAALAPALVVASGDEVVSATLDAWWSDEAFAEEFAERRVWATDDARRGHALTGPVAVEGLVRGDVLQVDVLSLVPGDYGFTTAGGVDWGHLKRLGCHEPPPRMLLWELGAGVGGGVGRCKADGREFRVKLAPFLGVLGMPDGLAGEQSTTPPRHTGGNMDCRLQTQGTTVFLPVEVDGGLLSFGDGHAAQGDGEVSNNGIECAFREVRLRLTRRRDMPYCRTPMTRTVDAWVVLGLGKTLDQAAEEATNAMLDLMCERLGVGRKVALGLASVAVDLHLTQVVNGTKGIHAVWRDGALSGEWS
jgi:acetamidase/formamidase